MDRLLDTAPPGPALTARGRAQARALAEVIERRHADWPIAAVYASIATRAQQTAQPAADRLGLAVRVLPGVHEVSAGELEGRGDEESVRRFRATVQAWHDGDLERAQPGGESGTQVLTRYLGAVRRLRAAHPDQTVLLVSHGAATRLAAWSLAPGDARLRALTELHNAGLIVLEPDGARGWHCVEHHLGATPAHGDPTGDQTDH